MEKQNGIENRMRIAHIITGDTWAGAEVVTYELLRSLVSDQSIDLTAIILNKGIVYDKIASLGIKTYFCSDGLSFFYLVRRVVAIVKNNNIAILHVHKRYEDIIAFFIKMFCKDTILIRTIHGMTEKREGLRAFKDVIYRVVEIILLKLIFTKIIAVSHDIKQNYGWGLINNKAVVINNAVDSNKIRCTKERQTMKKFIFDEKDVFLFGSVGRLEPVKGYDIFLRMAKIVSKIINNSRFVIVGEGKIRKELEGLAVELGIEKKIKFTGFKKNIYDYLNAFDVFVLSSLSEGIPTVILESAILKVPIISTDVGGINEILKNGESAKLVKSNDPVALADTCIDVYNNYPKAKERAKTAYAEVNAKFTISDAHEKVKKIYRSAFDKLSIIPQ